MPLKFNILNLKITSRTAWIINNIYMIYHIIYNDVEMITDKCFRDIFMWKCQLLIMFLFIPARIRQQRNRRCRVCQNMPPLSEEPPRPDYHSFVFHHYNLSFFSQVEFQHILSFIIIYVFFLPETPHGGSTSFPVLISSNRHLQ